MELQEDKFCAPLLAPMATLLIAPLVSSLSMRAGWVVMRARTKYNNMDHMDKNILVPIPIL